MKLSKDQRRIIYSSIVYFISSAVIFPIYHLIKGSFEWKDTLIYAAAMAVVCLLIAFFFVIGSTVPKNDDKSNPGKNNYT